jgi:hypothetical protein
MTKYKFYTKLVQNHRQLFPIGGSISKGFSVQRNKTYTKRSTFDTELWQNFKIQPWTLEPSASQRRELELSGFHPWAVSRLVLNDVDAICQRHNFHVTMFNSLIYLYQFFCSVRVFI